MLKGNFLKIEKMTFKNFQKKNSNFFRFSNTFFKIISFLNDKLFENWKIPGKLYEFEYTFCQLLKNEIQKIFNWIEFQKMLNNVFLEIEKMNFKKLSKNFPIFFRFSNTFFKIKFFEWQMLKNELFENWKIPGKCICLNVLFVNFLKVFKKRLSKNLNELLFKICWKGNFLILEKMTFQKLSKNFPNY